ncbi:MAG: glycosyltransferase family 2 protein [Bryobacteraceae bacterium]
MSTGPLVSIVTPSLNMAGFIEEAVESVLSQDYPQIEYVVMDGGSTDGTLEILERHRDGLRYVSARDSGAADAINKGFEMSRGSILGWLNADDRLLAGAVGAAVRRLAADPGLGAVYGQAYWVNERGEVLRPYPTEEFNEELLANECFICQPACFFRREAYERVGGLDTELQYSFDYDLWIRMARTSRFGRAPEFLAHARMHRGSKTLGSRKEVLRETIQVLKRRYGYAPFKALFSYYCFLLDGRDQFYEPLRPSTFKYLLSLPAGCWENRRRLPRYCREWWEAVRPRPGWVGRKLGRARGRRS